MAATQDDAKQRIAAAKQHLAQGKPDEAASVMEQLLIEQPDDVDALYVLAVAERFAQRYDKALATLQRLLGAAPEYGRAFQEVGYNLRAQGDEFGAIAAFERATTCDPSLVPSWKILEQFHAAQGDEPRRRAAASQRSWFEGLPTQLKQVAGLIGEGQLHRAEEACRAYLQNAPRDIEGMRFLAQIGVRLGILDDAEFLLESAVEFAPDHRAARFEYASVLRRRQKFAKAGEQVDVLTREDADNPAYLTLRANIASATGEHDKALGLYRKLLGHSPDQKRLHLSCGHALKTIGDVDEAITAYRAAYRVDPAFGDAYWSLANLKTYQFTDAEVSQMQRHVGAAGTSTEDAVHLSFALGKHHEDASEFDEAFKAYDKGNRLKQSSTRYTIEGNREECARIASACSAELFTDKHGSGNRAVDPIFIVGMPRAGSTLLEQILASHGDVDGTLELPNIVALAHRLDGRRLKRDDHLYPAILQELDAEALQLHGENYIEETRIFREGAPRFTDKMPNNFKHVGLISLILPNAKIIDIRRHPMACCFSNFKQLFAEGQEFTYGLERVGAYYRDYVDLMDHWDAVLPGKVLRVSYEDLTNDLESEVRRILDYCDLPFDPACLSFHESKRAVRTPSSEQVRQPIYTSAQEQWRNFEPWLGPLKDALGPELLKRYPID